MHGWHYDKNIVWIPASLQGPGKVKVTLMSSDESRWYGETEFLYTEDPPTEEEFLSKVVKDRNMWQKLFDRISSSKPSDGQASDSSGKTGPSKFFFYSNLTYVIVPLINLIKFLVF